MTAVTAVGRTETNRTLDAVSDCRYCQEYKNYGSLLLNAGANAEVIQELLGHADMRMTRRVYAHLLNVTIANTVKSKLPSFGHERSNVRKLRP